MVGLALVGDTVATGDRGREIGKYNAWRMAAGGRGSVSAAGLYVL